MVGGWEGTHAEQNTKQTRITQSIADSVALIITAQHTEPQHTKQETKQEAYHT